MKRPWWRSQTQHWYVETPQGQVRLSKERDPDGGERKHPPPAIETAWHKLAHESQPQDMRVGKLFEDYKKTITGSDLAAATNQHLDKFEVFVGSQKKVLDLKGHDLTRYIETKPHWKPSTIRTFVNRVHAAINWGVAQGLVEHNPISSKKGYKRQGRFERRKGLISEEHRQIAERESFPDFRAFLVALRETGARPSELRRARIEKTNLDNGYVDVPNKTARQTGKAERRVYLSSAAREVFGERIGERTEGYVFLTRQGKPWKHDTLKKRWWRLQQRFGIKGSLYQMRHGFASKAINKANVNPALVASLMGHADLTMLLKHYPETDPAALQKALEQINAPPAATP